MLKIYGRANSINVRKVLWMCNEVGVRFEREDIGRGFAPTDTPEYLAINPMGLIPAIDDDGAVVAESNTIVRYLAAKSGNETLLPLNPMGRAHVEQWMDWQAAEMTRPLRTLFIGGHLGMEPHSAPERQAAALAELSKHMSIVDGQIGRTDGHIVGGPFTVADVAVGVVVHRWFALDIERDNFANLAAYYDRLSERPGYRAHVRNELP